MNPADENSLDNVIEEFFNQLVIQHQYYSVQSKQPILLIGEKDLYKAIKEAIGKANNNSNTAKIIDQKPQFKQLSSFSLPKI